jgi:hypothetical protein
MTYDSSDPRAALAVKRPEEKKPATEFAAAEYFRFYEMGPTEISADGTRTWYVRGQNFVLAFSEVGAGAELARQDQPDEYVVLLPTMGAEITAAGQSESVPANTLCIVPPGNSRIRAAAAGTVVRLFTVRSEDLTSLCVNHHSYDQPHPNVALFEPWPEPPAGYRLRVHRLDDYPPQPGRLGRIFRCTTFMVNCFEPAEGPRDPAKMSPHTHDDFEQCSLALDGDYIHHIRTPWTSDLNAWRDDEHEFCGTPSIVIIPPPTVHTTQAVNEGTHRLVDVFCPPRVDFSLQPGWVLNADEYPMS